VKAPDGNSSYMIKSISIEFGQIDFTNPAARIWTKNIIKNNLIKEGRSVGWMHDFGEYTPMDARYHNWTEASQNHHNLYPYEWAKIVKEAIEEAGTSSETVAFMRSGSTLSPSMTSLYWMGDQMPSLDKYDGLHSALIGMLNGGMSGYTLGHSDIGGYTTVTLPGDLHIYKRDEETLKRWIEMNAFSDAIYRSHPSCNPAVNAQIWDNEEIAGFFAKFAKVFVDLGDYRL